MKRKLWIRIGAVVLAALLLWWLFWAILIDEDENEGLTGNRTNRGSGLIPCLFLFFFRNILYIRLLIIEKV